MGRKGKKEQSLPEPPDTDRRVLLDPLKWIWIGLLVLVPLLAVIGIFGPRDATAAATASGLELRVRYPSVLRHGMTALLVVDVRNTRSEAVSRAIVRLDRAFVEHFSEPKPRP